MTTFSKEEHLNALSWAKHGVRAGSSCMAYAVLDKMPKEEREALHDKALRSKTYWAEELQLKLRINALVHRQFYGTSPWENPTEFRDRMESAANLVTWEFLGYGESPTVEILALVKQVYFEMEEGFYPAPDSFM